MVVSVVLVVVGGVVPGGGSKGRAFVVKEGSEKVREIRNRRGAEEKVVPLDLPLSDAKVTEK